MYCLSTIINMGPMPVPERQSNHLLYETQLLLDQCTSTYLARSQTHVDAMRAGILHYEVWKSFDSADRLDWSGTSKSLVKIASEVSQIDPLQLMAIILIIFSLVHIQVEDVLSAILMEQAAQADVQGIKKLVRKNALHSVMAARRFEHSGQVRAFSSMTVRDDS
jgi:hypothetical protein